MMKYSVIARAAWGATLLLMPERMVGAVSGQRIEFPVTSIVRVLGARQVAQALTLQRSSDPRWLYLGAVVDALHCVSMAGLAGISSEYRFLAGMDSIIAGTLAIEDVLQARRAGPLRDS